MNFEAKSKEKNKYQFKKTTQMQTIKISQYLSSPLILYAYLSIAEFNKRTILSLQIAIKILSSDRLYISHRTVILFSL